MNASIAEPSTAVQPASSRSLADVLGSHRDERHLIVLHSFPDPDALSSAFAHRLLSAAFGITADIVHGGRLSHPQNIALVKLLGIELTPYSEGLTLDGYAGAVFLDNQGAAADGLVHAVEAAQIPPIIIVDHHEPQNRLRAEFTDIRRVGATATLYAEYLERGDVVALDKSRKDHVLAATALMHGILTDTDGLIHAGAEDFQAVAFLSQFRDAALLKQIVQQARSKQTMEVIRRALGNRMAVESFSIAGIGYLRAEDRDAIPQAADFLITEENVHTAIVYGLVVGERGEESLIGSLRTSKITLDPDEFIKTVFGKNAAGRYFGGGKLAAGAFEIPVEFLAGDHGDEFRDRKWLVYDSQVKHKVLAKLGLIDKPVVPVNGESK
ncbi:MAG: DHH family phosphoesterase [Anaerolineales bacterium]